MGEIIFVDFIYEGLYNRNISDTLYVSFIFAYSRARIDRSIIPSDPFELPELCVMAILKNLSGFIMKEYFMV
jgi:hypothetical protein